MLGPWPGSRQLHKCKVQARGVSVPLLLRIFQEAVNGIA